MLVQHLRKRVILMPRDACEDKESWCRLTTEIILCGILVLFGYKCQFLLRYWMPTICPRCDYPSGDASFVLFLSFFLPEAMVLPGGFLCVKWLVDPFPSEEPWVDPSSYPPKIPAPLEMPPSPCFCRSFCWKPWFYFYLLWVYKLLTNGEQMQCSLSLPADSKFGGSLGVDSSFKIDGSKWKHVGICMFWIQYPMCGI